MTASKDIAKKYVSDVNAFMDKLRDMKFKNGKDALPSIYTEKTFLSRTKEYEAHIEKMNSLINKDQWKTKEFDQALSDTQAFIDKIRDEVKTWQKKPSKPIEESPMKVNKSVNPSTDEPTSTTTSATEKNKPTKLDRDDGLDSTLMSLNKQNRDLKENIQTTKQTLKKEQKKGAKLEDEIKETKSKLKKTEGAIESLESDLTEAKSEAKISQSEIEALRKQVSELSEQAENKASSKDENSETATSSQPNEQVSGIKKEISPEASQSPSPTGDMQAGEEPAEEQKSENKADNTPLTDSSEQKGPKSTEATEKAPSSSNPIQRLLEFLKSLLAKLFGGGDKKPEGMEKRSSTTIIDNAQSSTSGKDEENIEMVGLNQQRAEQELASQIEKEPEVNRTTETAFSSSTQIEQRSTRSPLTSPKDSSINDQSVIDEQQRALDQYNKTKNKGIEPTDAPKATTTSKEQLEVDHAFAMNLAREEMQELRNKSKPSQDNPQQLKSMEDTPEPPKETPHP